MNDYITLNGDSANKINLIFSSLPFLKTETAMSSYQNQWAEI